MQSFVKTIYFKNYPFNHPKTGIKKYVFSSVHGFSVKIFQKGEI